MKKSRIIKISAISVPAALILAFFIFTGVRSAQFKKLDAAQPLTFEQSGQLNLTLINKYSEQNDLLKALPYTLPDLGIKVGADAAILIDVSNGNIIYEKNADKVIPPASMTKLFAMYVVEQEVAEGRLHYDDIIPLPSECWACNMPPHSSLMFLGKGQIVTLEELLLGLSICSGNDAAYALAYAVCGSMEEFVERMNQVAQDAGLTHTHFVESSGYSEQNVTTAREMAAFCRLYILEHPDSLKRFHSVPSFTYPKAKNMAPGDRYGAQDWSNGLPEKITMGITQENTNPLLGRLAGCDGLKTGYIDESGYNLALTVARDGTRFLSVTMGGKGNNTQEGQAGRVNDGTELMETAFSIFRDYDLSGLKKSYFVKVYAGSQKGLNLITAYNPQTVCVPFVTGNSIAQNLQNVQIKTTIPQYLQGQITAGAEYGKIEIILGDYILQTIPLVADRSTERAGWIVCLADGLIHK
ncbi:MAG: D-alanyl-D-alanine carboxypeptidase [Treponema sp.]|nr:D-alanyl-D-alanine carboxypeptidase [Treponema sp.]MBR5032949.1 D-alanyl-D-alanine carboxypeptidase [Treponema sp.]